MSDTELDLLSDRVAAQGVRDLLDGKLTGPPLPGTLADRVSGWGALNRRMGRESVWQEVQAAAAKAVAEAAGILKASQ